MQLRKYLAVLIVLVGCQATSSVMVDRAMVRNATTRQVSDVRVRHEPTGRIGAVNAIYPGRSLDVGFTRQPLRAERAIVTWKDMNRSSHRIALHLPALPPGLSVNQDQTLIYTIHQDNTVTVELQP